MDGCRRHGVISTTATLEWDRIEQVVNAAGAGLAGDELRDEINAQANAIVICHCCMAPSLDKITVLCSTCAASDGCGCDYCKAVLC